MAPSAIYRYFDGRDALLHALILGAYEVLADGAALAGSKARGRDVSDVERWGAAPRAMRAWAVSNPQQWGLIFGSPVPGYEAPDDTTDLYARLAGAVVEPVSIAWAEGRIAPGRFGDGESRQLRSALSPVVEALAPDLPAELVMCLVQSWATIVGMISLEVFGHWKNTVLDPGLAFESMLRTLAGQLGLVPLAAA